MPFQGRQPRIELPFLLAKLPHVVPDYWDQDDNNDLWNEQSAEYPNYNQGEDYGRDAKRVFLAHALDLLGACS